MGSHQQHRLGWIPIAFAIASVLVASAASIAFAAGGTVAGKVVAPAPKYVGETVIYIDSVPASWTPKRVTLDQKGMRFLPHVLTITQGDTVAFLNHDTVAHNVFSSDFESYNLGTFKPNELRTHVFADTTGVYTQLCSIHPEMLGFIFVGQNPYSAVVDATGRYTIANVPAGTYQLDIWNSHFKAAQQSITVKDGGTVEADFTLTR